MRIYLSSTSPWNSTYSNDEGNLLFKVSSTKPSPNLRKVTIHRALPDVSLPTSERQLWEERHFFETHASTQRDHPELDGQGSGLPDDLILEENRDSPTLNGESSDSLYEYPLQPSSPSPSRSIHSDSHPFWVKEHWVHFADIDYNGVHNTHFNVAGKEFDAAEFFENDGFRSWALGSSRVFQAWNGHWYRWDLRDKNVKLWLIDDEKTSSPRGTPSTQELVAEFRHMTITNSMDLHRRKVSPPTLIIHPSGEQIIDFILVTFIFGELCSREGTVGIQGNVDFTAARVTPHVAA